MKIRHAGFLFASICLLAGSVWAQPPEPDSKVPKKKWFQGEKGYLEALEIQKATGADIFIYFFNHDEKDEKGLCSWWENRGMQEGKVAKLLENYVKVKVAFPVRKKEEPTFSKFRVNKTPAIFVAKPTGFPTRITVFDWTNDRPVLRENQEIADLISKASTPAPNAAEVADPAKP